jgi:hypothetical protein
MALDELHERWLATLMNLFDVALDRIELVLAAAEQRDTVDDGPPAMMPAKSGRRLKTYAAAWRLPLCGSV